MNDRLEVQSAGWRGTMSSFLAPGHDALLCSRLLYPGASVQTQAVSSFPKAGFSHPAHNSQPSAFGVAGHAHSAGISQLSTCNEHACVSSGRMSVFQDFQTGSEQLTSGLA